MTQTLCWCPRFSLHSHPGLASAAMEKHPKQKQLTEVWHREGWCRNSRLSQGVNQNGVRLYSLRATCSLPPARQHLLNLKHQVFTHLRREFLIQITTCCSPPCPPGSCQSVRSFKTSRKVWGMMSGRPCTYVNSKYENSTQPRQEAEGCCPSHRDAGLQACPFLLFI